METKAEIIRRYADADPPARVDLICRYYSRIDGIIESIIGNMVYIIWEEREKNKRESLGDLGVRVQSGGAAEDPTGNHAIFNIEIERAIRNCDFSDGILKGVDHEQEIISEAYILRDMKKMHDLYHNQLRGLNETDKSLYTRYLTQEITLSEIADLHGIDYYSAAKKMQRIRQTIRRDIGVSWRQ